MLDYSFIQVLETLSPEEIKKFKEFIRSPYFNKSEKAVKLFESLIRFHPNYAHPKLTKEYLHRKVSPELQYNEITMRRLLYDMQHLCERFLLQISSEKKELDARNNMTEELGSRGIKKLFLKNITNMESLLSKEGVADGEYFLDKYQFEKNKYNMWMIYKTTGGGSRVNSKIDTLTEAGNLLISYFTTEIVKIHDNLNEISINRNINIKSNQLIRFIDGISLKKIIEYLDVNSKDNADIFKIYYFLFLAFTHFEEEKYYYSFKSLLLKKSETLSKDEKHYLYHRLLTYCQTKSNAGKSEFNKELFEVQKLFLMYEYYKTGTNIYMPVALYRNVLILALKLKKYEWLDFFVKSNLNKIEPEQQENLYHYTYANLYFANGEYEKSLEQLMNLNYDYFIFKLDMKSLLLRIYYELNYYESAYSLIDCYNHILRRSKLVNPLRKTTHGNFVQYVQKLLKLKLTPDQGEARLLRKQIAGNKEVLNKEWLLEKADELSKRYRKAM